MIINKHVILIQFNNRYSGELTIDKNSIHLESKLCSVTKGGDFDFYILKDIRKELQKYDAFVLINGSRKEVYPSGMTLSGHMAYVHTLGKQTSLTDLVNIFDDLMDMSKISTVEEQDEYHNQWVQSLR